MSKVAEPDSLLIEAQSELFGALANPSRLRMILMLSSGERCVCEIVSGLKMAQPTVSHHLDILRSAGLVDVRQKGKWSYYWLKRKNILDLVEQVELMVRQQIREDAERFTHAHARQAAAPKAES